jgi:prepilin-type N-terminal cleavage/methylation domain-containing protein
MEIFSGSETGNKTMRNGNTGSSEKLLLDDKAFTLIEVIVSMVLIGVMAAIAGMGLVVVTRGYVFSKQNADTMLKSQVAMTRIVKELSSIRPTDTISSATNASITYTKDGVAGVSHTISWTGNILQIDGVTLINNVTAFSLAYANSAGGVIAIGSTSPSQAVLNGIRRMVVNMTIRGADNVDSAFSNSVKIQESNW